MMAKQYLGLEVTATYPGPGHLCRCPCGWSGFSAYGRARRHAETCPASPSYRISHAQAWENLRDDLDPLEAERAVVVREASA